ncbi:YitT family protein [Acutalibacter caecimuris]|uniref:YitT family protein n=1 Tax=Acutalibacter caecimuris TaxID=3093657 RepID=UPI002AC9D46C|nr:YitT family protein [Acutalibacter sp. M00118]
MDEETLNRSRLGNLLRKGFSRASLQKFLTINLGVLLSSLGVYFFKFPNNFTTGGVSGLSIILGRLVPVAWLSPATMMWVINMVLLAVGFMFLSKDFGFWTAYCSVAFSAETWLLEKLCPMETPFTDQPLLELCFAVMLPAVGSALLFNSNASTGGTDIVAMILKKYTGLEDIGKALFASDGLIALSACWIFGMKTGLFSLLGLFLKAFVVDSVIENINLCKFFSIVTSKPQEICDYIIHDMNRSSTVVDAVGAYSHVGCKVVLIACRRGEALRLRQKCKQVDPQCFMFITNTSEIIGKGFRTV